MVTWGKENSMAVILALDDVFDATVFIGKILKKKGHVVPVLSHSIFPSRSCGETVC